MKKYKILVVDDERPLAELMRIKLDEAGFQTITANSGNEAIEKSASEEPSLIILDVMMGDMDGWEALSKLKSNPETAKIPVIMCTARDGQEDVDKSFSRGAQAYVIKPVNFPKLYLKINAILDTEELLKR